MGFDRSICGCFVLTFSGPLTSLGLQDDQNWHSALAAPADQGTLRSLAHVAGPAAGKQVAFQLLFQQSYYCRKR